MKPDAPSDPPREHLQLPSGPVAYTDVGEGPVLIACHGCPGSVRDWRWMGPVLEGPTRFIRLDMPGFGETPLKTWWQPDAAGRAAFVLAVADALGIERFAVMGHSAGGPVTLELGARHADRVTAMALLAVPGLRPHRPLREAPVMHRISPWLRIPGIKHAMAPVLRRGFESAGFPRNLPAEALWQSMHVVGSFHWQRQAENAARVSVPHLLAWTADDHFIEDAVEAELAAALPQGRRLRFEDGGHMLQKHRATEIGEAIVAMLRAPA